MVGSLGEEIFEVFGYRYLIYLPRVLVVNTVVVNLPRTIGTFDDRDHLYKVFIILY